MIKSPDPRLPADVLFLLWAMAHGDEVAVVDPSYFTDAEYAQDVACTVVRMADVDVPQGMRAVLSALQLDTTFVAHPVRQIRHGGSEPLHEIRRAVQAEVDEVLGFSCPITAVAEPDFRAQVDNCFALIVTGDARRRGAFILRKGLDVTPDSIVSPRGGRSW
jgi:L-fucose mutarotase